MVANNFFGQNTPAIAATETLYAEFWAQDAGAMYTYAGSSAAATQLAELPEPAQVVDPGRLADQAIAAFKAQNQVLQTGVGNVLAQINPRVTTVLQTLSAPLNGTAIDQWLAANTPLDDVIPLYSKYLSPYVSALAAVFSSGQGFGQSSSGLVAMANLLNGLAPAAQAVQGAAQAAGSALVNSGANLGGSIGGVAAGLGKAVPLGGLSVPASWTTSATSGAPGTTNLAVASLTNAAAAPPVANGAAGGVPAAPPFGQFVNSGRGRKLPSYGFRLTFMTKPPAAG